MLPSAVTDAAIAGELPGVRAWAERHQIALDTRLIAERIIRVVLVQEKGEKFYLQGNFADYRELPPIWDWRGETWSATDGLHLSPGPQGTPFGASMFIQHNNRGLICAPFNRLAYGTHNGPHSNWGDLLSGQLTGQGTCALRQSGTCCSQSCGISALRKVA